MCQAPLGRYVLKEIEQGRLPSDLACRQRFSRDVAVTPQVISQQHALADYDQLLLNPQAVAHG